MSKLKNRLRWMAVMMAALMIGFASCDDGEKDTAGGTVTVKITGLPAGAGISGMVFIR
jgi:chorismate synthase